MQDSGPLMVEPSQGVSARGLGYCGKHRVVDARVELVAGPE